MRSLLRRMGRGSGPGWRFGRTVMRHARRRERQVVKLLIRPAPPTGPGDRERDRVERIRLRPSAARSPLRTIHLDDQLAGLQQVTTQTGAVTPGALDRPGPQSRVA